LNGLCSQPVNSSVEPPDIGVCNLPVKTFYRDGTHVVTGIDGFTLIELSFQKKILYTPPLIKAMKNHRAEERRA